MTRKVFWVKQIVTLLVVLIISLAFVGEAQAANREQYKQLTGDKKFTEIKEQVTKSALSVSKYKASDVYQEMVNALDDLRKLHTLVQQATHVDDVIEKVVDELDQLASTYERVAALSAGMTQYRKDEFSYLQGVNGETLNTQRELKERIAELKSNNKLLQKKSGSATDEIESKKLEISLRGNDFIIKSLEAQSIIWDKFYQAQGRLLQSLDLNGRKVDLLCHMLQVNAQVYREASTVAQLRRSAKSALESLRSLADIQGIIGDLQDSWLQVNGIVSEISKAEFTIDIE